MEPFVEDQLLAAVARRPVANGLAVIVANVTSMKRNYLPLPGVTRDLDAMRMALDALKFATLPMLNASKEEIERAVQAVAWMEFPPTYKRFIFVFSGHGEQGFVDSHTGPLSLYNNVLMPLMPICAPKSELTIRDMPKIFLIDSCRGDRQDMGVCISPTDVVPRGPGKVPSISNFLLACSTQPCMQSFETPEGGGFWMQLVAEKLCTENRSILDVLTALNRDVNDRIQQSHSSEDPTPVCMQQPILESSLNDVVNLLEESRQLNVPLPQEGQPVMYRILPTVMPQPTTSLSGQLMPHRGVTAATDLSSQKKNRPKLAAVFSDSSVASPQPLCLGSHSHSSAELLGMSLSSPGPFQPASDTAPLRTKRQPSLKHPALSTGVKSTTEAKEEQQPLGHFKSQLNQYQQRGIIKNYSYSEEEQYKDSRIHFRSCVSVTLPNGEVVQGSSGDFHIIKQTAKELAAKDAVRKIDSKGHRHSSPCPQQPSTATTPGHYREKLNHYQQKGYIKNYSSTSYTDKQTSHQSPLFRSCLTVILCSSGKEIKGHSEKLCPSKQEARELAAKDAFEKICLALGHGPLQVGGANIEAHASNSPLPSPPVVAAIRAPLPPNPTSSTKTSKSKLKEYFDQKALPPPRYHRTQVEGGFQAKVQLPGGRGWVSGDVKSNSKDAEHDAARAALQELKL